MRTKLAVLWFITIPALAGTIVVDNDFSDCPQATFSTISGAVAVALPGDKILVCPGIYAESVLVDKNDLRIEAQAGPGAVVVQGVAAQPFGFHLLNTSGVVLQGFQIQGFGTADIEVVGGGENTLRKNVTTLSGFDGIQLISSSGNVVEHNASFGNPDPVSAGIYISPTSSRNVARHNLTYDNGFGFYVEAALDNVVFHNTCHHNRFTGISNVVRSHGTIIENNQLFANTWGLIVGNSMNVTAENNRAEDNTVCGIRLQNSAANNRVQKNEALNNGQDGFCLQNNVDTNVLHLNVVKGNGRDGIRVFDTASAGNTIERNLIRESGEHDAHDDSVGSGTGGTANFWVDNHCETENRPGLCRP